MSFSQSTPASVQKWSLQQSHQSNSAATASESYLHLISRALKDSSVSFYRMVSTSGLARPQGSSCFSYRWSDNRVSCFFFIWGEWGRDSGQSTSFAARRAKTSVTRIGKDGLPVNYSSTHKGEKIEKREESDWLHLKGSATLFYIGVSTGSSSRTI